VAVAGEQVVVLVQAVLVVVVMVAELVLVLREVPTQAAVAAVHF
jgi:hypothetical protein